MDKYHRTPHTCDFCYKRSHEVSFDGVNWTCGACRPKDYEVHLAELRSLAIRESDWDSHHYN